MNVKGQRKSRAKAAIYRRRWVQKNRAYNCMYQALYMRRCRARKSGDPIKIMVAEKDMRFFLENYSRSGGRNKRIQYGTDVPVEPK